VAEQDGDGWARCDQGQLHWGRFGAVGLLAYACADGGGRDGGTFVLLVRRNWWGQHGGTWGPPGGARDSDEPPIDAARREAAEECDLPPDGVKVQAMLLDDHGGWSYRTYVAAASALFPVHAASPEITEARWVDAAAVASLPLHPGFAEHWPVLSAALVPVTVIVDVANVMGSRADGWWRDRAAAAVRLQDQVISLSERGVASLPQSLDLPRLDLWFPDFVLVAEGAARSAAFTPAGHVRVAAAPASGDDEIAAQARALPGRRLVVTADRELRRRCEAAGASVTGPGWLLAQL
jgi:8-oxo-dGTP pyrophosphatase MutT (NUDIX family)